MCAMTTETELKLQLHPIDLPVLLAHPLLAKATPAERLLNTYFDTPDLALKKRRMAVRERLAGQTWLLTAKTAGSSVGGVSRRREWEGPTAPGTLDFAALVDDTALAAELMVLRPGLRSLFCTDFVRRRWVLSHAGAQVEVALDEGTVSVPGSTLSEPLLEVELELLSGPESALLSLAALLRDCPAGLLGLLPSDVSKAQRGMALWERSLT